MSFAKNVQKYQKWVLGTVVAVMALSLVVSFGNFNPDYDESKPYATIFEKVTVSEREWFAARAKAGAWFRLKVVDRVDNSTDYSESRLQPYLFKYQDRPGMLALIPDYKPDEQDYVACAREIIVLGYDARAKQVRVSDEEVTAMVHGFFDRAGVSDEDADQQLQFARMYFLVERESDFLDAVRDWIMVEKSLALDVGGSNVPYEQVFNERLSNSRAVRVMVAGIDGSSLPPDLVSVSDDRIRQEFDTNRESYKMPAKVQIEYLMANLDDFRKKAKDPTPEEIQKYYEDNKRQFLKTKGVEPGHVHEEGDDHKHEGQVDEFKTIEEVREEIITKIKDAQASREAFSLVMRVSSKNYVDRYYKFLEEEKARDPKDPKSVRERALARTGPVFAEIREQLKAEGIELRNGMITPVEKNQREPLTTELGKQKPGAGSDPLEWAMNAPVGDVSNQIYQSDKGYALLRLDQKIEGYEIDLTAPIREKIRKDLEKGSASDRARRLATELESRIRSNGQAEIARLRTRNDVKIQRSAYLSQTSADAESGLVPSSLAQQIKGRALKPAADPNAPEVQVVDGAMLGGGDRKDWSYVVVVEDSVQVAPEVKDDDFLADVRRKEASEVAKAKAIRAQELVGQAEWTDAAKAKAPAK